MKTDQQIQPDPAPETDSKESPKSKRGGKRPGAGRKPNLAKRLLKGVHRDTIIAAVQDIDVGSVISGLLRSKKELIQLQTLEFVFDRILGRPKNDLHLTGAVLHAHSVYRDPSMAVLTEEELGQLDTITKKLLVAPVQDAVQDGPQNQIESKPRIAAAGVDQT